MQKREVRTLTDIVAEFTLEQAVINFQVSIKSDNISDFWPKAYANTFPEMWSFLDNTNALRHFIKVCECPKMRRKAEAKLFMLSSV